MRRLGRWRIKRLLKSLNKSLAVAQGFSWIGGKEQRYVIYRRTPRNVIGVAIGLRTIDIQLQEVIPGKLSIGTRVVQWGVSLYIAQCNGSEAGSLTPFIISVSRRPVVHIPARTNVVVESIY